MGYPIVPGHEIAGLVHVMGKKASKKGRFSVGDRVIVYPWCGCGSCPVCEAGDYNHCPVISKELGFCNDGGYAEFVQVVDYCYLLKCPESVPFSLAALLPCGALTAFSAVKRSVQVANRVRKWKRDIIVAVCGLGGVGQWALKLLPFCLGGNDGIKVIGVDINQKKIEAVKNSGLVHNTFLLSPEDTVDQQIEKFEEEFHFKPDIILDIVNSSETFKLCVGILANCGIHVMVGLYGGLGELQLPLATLSASMHTGNFVGSFGDLEELVKVIMKSKISPPPIKEYKLNEATQALKYLEKGLVNGRAVLVMD